VKMGTQRSRLAENVMSPNPPPYDVGLARYHLVAILECRTAIGSPRHFEDPGCALHALDPQAFPELTTSPEVLDELRHRRQERGLLLRAEANEVSPKTREPLERGQTYGRERRRTAGFASA
jgi:hypothetical protein